MAQVNETANNNTIATATNLGNIRNSPFVRGDLFGSDSADFFKFQVDRPVKGGVAVVPGGVDTNLILFNSSGQPIRNSLKPGTATESISFDNLPTGEYTLLVSKSTGSGSYTLSANGNAISGAEMSVTINNLFTTAIFDELASPIGGDFSGFLEADFYTQVTIAGVTQTSRTFKDNRAPEINFTASQAVDLSNQKIPITIRVFDADPGPDQQADINSTKGVKGLALTYDTLIDEISGAGISTRREGFLFDINPFVIPEGDGDPVGMSFRVNYDTFTSSTSFSNSTPVIRGTNASQDLTGQNLGGILCGEGGNDNLSGLGGNDALCGGTGNDILNGGTGNDISDGGAGRDTHIGGSGRDTFVLTLNSGVDVIKDFQNGRDKLGLSIELNPEILDIVQQGKNTVVGVGDQRLAILSNVKANQITAADFVTVDFTRFRGMEVPTVVA
jgi:serralysin